jgi:lipopolysaccharide export system protein LptA
MRAILVSALALCAMPALAAAQAGSCVLNQDASGSVTRTENVTSVRGVVVDCAGGVRIRANEGNIFHATGQTDLFGNVVFVDGTKRLTSQTAVYTSSTGRLHATGDVVFTDTEAGATLRGPDVELYRAVPGRPQQQVIASLRPQLTIQSEPRNGEAQEPLEIDADRINIIGNYLNAAGNVVIRQPDMTAYANDANFDRDSGRLNLTGRARMESDRFRLNAEQIEARLPGDRLELLIARTNGVLLGEDLRIDAPEIRMSFDDDRLERLVARRLTGQAEQPQPIATSAEFVLRADSIDARMPQQRLEHVAAVGNARGETVDATATGTNQLREPSLSDELALDQNWVLGDTINGYFEAPETGAAGADTTIVLKRIVASGSARSLYRVENQQQQASTPAPVPDAADDAAPETPTIRQALNYLAGERIELTFNGGQVDNAQVEGLQRGIYLDPTTVAPAAPAASETRPVARGRRP